MEEMHIDPVENVSSESVELTKNLTEANPLDGNVMPGPEIEQAIELSEPIDLEKLGGIEDPGQVEPELTELEKLTQKRTGFWQLNLQEPDVKWIKNACNKNFEFNGPNEAFMLMSCFLGFSAAHARMNPGSEAENHPCVVQASAVEACAYFMNRVTGNNVESAQRVFRIAMALNPIIMEMRKLDDQIQALRSPENDGTMSAMPQKIEKPSEQAE